MDRPVDAAERLAAFLDRLDRVPMGELRLLAVRPLDPAAHDAARAAAEEAARFGGRAALVDDAVRAITGWLERAFTIASYEVTLLGVGWRPEPLGVADRARLRDTLIDAALAVATADRIDEATYDELIGPCEVLAD